MDKILITLRLKQDLIERMQSDLCKMGCDALEYLIYIDCLEEAIKEFSSHLKDYKNTMKKLRD